MAVVHHIIQKQFLEVEMRNPPDAFAFRNSLSALYYERLLPQLEALFNELGTEKKLIRKEFLEIDIGVVPKENWEELLVQKTVQQVRAALLQERAVLLKTVESREADRKNASIAQEAENFSGLFLSLVQKGHLPWHTGSNFSLPAELDNWLCVETFKTEFLYILGKLERKGLLRLIYQLSEAQLVKTFKTLLSGDDQFWLEEFLMVLPTIKDYLQRKAVTKADQKQLLYLPFIEWLQVGRAEGLATNYWPWFFEGLDDLQDARLSADGMFEQLLRFYSEDKRLNKFLLQSFEQFQRKHATNNDPTPKKQKESNAKKLEQQENENELFVSNAGLVLLHPFLQPFFYELGLLNEDKSFKESYHQNAVLFSQYLLTGTTVNPEYDLLLNKIICGYPLEEPIDNELSISEIEILEANDLLNQLIASWTMNGVVVNNNIDGFRQSFLQRNGKLIRKEDDWLLQVEQQPYDMVLSSLPWGISIIKTAWMDGKLWVEWT